MADERRSASHLDGDAAYARYRAGLTLDEVAQEFGVSRERVRQVFSENEFPVRSLAETAALRRSRLVSEAGDSIRVAFAESRDIDEVAKKLALPRSVVASVVESSFTSKERRKKLRPVKRKYSDDELRSFLLEASTTLGGVLSANAYTKFARSRKTEDGRPWPTHQTFGLRYGTWRAALLDAGLAANPSSPIAGQVIFEVSHCVDALRAAAREVGTPLTTHAYDEYAKSTKGALPSLATVRHKLGRWPEALSRAGL